MLFCNVDKAVSFRYRIIFPVLWSNIINAKKWLPSLSKSILIQSALHYDYRLFIGLIRLVNLTITMTRLARVHTAFSVW